MRPRLLVVFSLLALPACASQPSQSAGPAKPDAYVNPPDVVDASAADAGADGVVYETSDFQALDWYYLTTAPGERIRVNADCGITASYDPLKGSGVLPPSECVAFKVFAVSPTMIAALSDKKPCTAPLVDDTGEVRLELLDAGVLERSITACKLAPPFGELRDRVHALRELYAPLRAPDAGADADGG